MLTQTAKYALRSLMYLTQQPDDGYHQTREIARTMHVPANYLGKTLQKLARARIVDSQKGLHGGFRIARLPEQVRLFDVLHAIDAIPRDLDAGRHDGKQVDLSSLYKRFAGVNRIYTKFLMETSLADLMKAEGLPIRGGRLGSLLKEESESKATTVLSL